MPATTSPSPKTQPRNPRGRRKHLPVPRPLEASEPIRRARPADLPALLELEATCFQPYRQASPRSLRRSLASPRQSVWVVDGRAGRLDALLVLWHHPRRVRVYDVAVHPDRQGHGLGQRLMHVAEETARRGGQPWVSLEADPKEPGLVAWYERQGYATTARLPMYYKNGNAAVRMAKRVR